MYILLPTRQSCFRPPLSSPLSCSSSRENRHAPRCPEQAKSSWFNLSQPLSKGVNHGIRPSCFYFPDFTQTKIPWKNTGATETFFLFFGPFKTSGDYSSLKPHVGLLREENAFQISSPSLRRFAQLLNKYQFHRQIKQESWPICLPVLTWG